MLIRWKIFIISFFLLSFSNSVAATPSGTTVSLPIITKDPTDLHGGRLSLWYEPKALTWQHARILLDGSLGYWWVTDGSPHDKINIFSVAPIFRYYIFHHPLVSPFFDISIGLSYLSATRLDDRNLGMHFAFQDQLGLGASIGTEKKFTISVYALHYSNGSLCGYNAGITIPLLLNIGYRF